MRRTFAIAAIFALAVPALALAQHEEEHRNGKAGQENGPPGTHQQQIPGGSMSGPRREGPPGPPGGSMSGPHGPPAAFAHPGGPPPGAAVQFSYHGHQFNRVHAEHEYVYPPGWSYRRWEVGGILPPLFLVPAYYYADWAVLGLDPPQPGYQWVRYGPDLLLVDVGTGQVVQVAYDVFY